MKLSLLAVLMVLVAGFVVPRAFGVLVTITPSANSTGSGTYLTGSNISITTSFSGGGYSEVLIEIAGGTGTIGDLSIVATSSIPVTVFITGSGAGGTMGSIGNISTSGSTASVTLYEVNTFGNIGSITAANIFGIFAKGTIGPITSQAASTGHAADIFSIVSGEGFRGDVTAEDGYIGQLTASGVAFPSSLPGTIGTPTTPITIRSSEAIGFVHGAHGVYADISGLSGEEFDVTFGRLNTNFGPFVGSIRASYFVTTVLDDGTYAPGLSVYGGDLDADVTISGDYVFNSGSSTRTIITVGTAGRAIPAGRTFTIGGGLNGAVNTEETNVAFDLPAGGLEGQIVINASDNAETWSAPIRVDGIKLDDGRSQPNDAPYYERMSSELGGGSVGLVPYHLHKSDCLPAHNETGDCGVTFQLRTWPASHGGEERETIILRHYGPVFDGEDGSLLDDPDTNPLVIERISLAVCYPTLCEDDDPDWTDRSALHDVYVPPGSSREVWVSLKLDENDEPRDFNSLHHHRISLRAMGQTTQLRSNGTFLDDENAPGIGGYPYELNPYCESLMSPPTE